MARVTLARVARADGPELVAAHLASRHLHHPWIRTFTDAEGFAAFYEDRSTTATASFVARDAATGRICGMTNLGQIVLKVFRSAYLSYWAMDGFQGRGLMTEAVRLTLVQAFDEIGLHRVEANIQPANAASQALARRLGFRHEGFSPAYLQVDGIWRDHDRFAILAEELAR